MSAKKNSDKLAKCQMVRRSCGNIAKALMVVGACALPFTFIDPFHGVVAEFVFYLSFTSIFLALFGARYKVAFGSLGLLWLAVSLSCA